MNFSSAGSAAKGFAKSMPGKLPGGYGVAIGVGALTFAYWLGPTMYHWDMIPFVGSPGYYERASRMKFDRFTQGIVYNYYDDGNPGPVYDFPPESENKIWTRDTNGKIIYPPIKTPTTYAEKYGWWTIFNNPGYDYSNQAK